MYLIIVLVTYLITRDHLYTLIISATIYVLLYMINQNNKTIQEKFDNDNDEINELIENKGGHDEETQKK